MSNISRPRASLYLRISVATEESDSIERQERDLRALATQEGLEVVEVRIDEGVSGAAKDRPAFSAWLADAAQGRADVLMAWRFDRISREGLGAVARILDVLKETGARLRTYGDNVDSESGGFRITAAVLSEVAYAERESIRSRVASRQAADRRKGLWTRERPYGYDVQGGRLVQRAEEAAIIRELAERYLGGASLRSLAADLTSRGLPTPRAAKGRVRRDGRTYAGEAWGLTTVRAILANPVLVGLYPHRVRAEGAKGREGERIVPARDDAGELVRVCEEPILSPGEFAAVQAHIESRTTLGPTGRRRSAVGAAPIHPLSGLARCGSCGGALVYDARSGRRVDGRAAYFRCQRHSHNPGACTGLFVRAVDLEEALIYRVLRYVPALDPEGPEVAALARRWLRSQRPDESADRRSAESEFADRQAEVADLEAARYERGEFPGGAGAERWRRLYDRALFRLRAAEAVLGALPEPSTNLGGLLDRTLLAEALEAGDEEARRDLYRVLIERVVVETGRGSSDLDRRVRPIWAAGSDEPGDVSESLREAPLAI